MQRSALVTRTMDVAARAVFVPSALLPQPSTSNLACIRLAYSGGQQRSTTSDPFAICSYVKLFCECSASSGTDGAG